LEEINEADLILHVVDVTHPNARQQSETVVDTLAELGVVDRPIIVALNKIDRLPDPNRLEYAAPEGFDCVAISAREQVGLEALLEHIEAVLAVGLVHVIVELPYKRGDLTTLFHTQGTVVEMSHSARGTLLEGYLSRRWLEYFRPYVMEIGPSEPVAGAQEAGGATPPLQ
jgi:GTP-binding protein HflX